MFNFFKSNNPGVVIVYLVYLAVFRVSVLVWPFNTDFLGAYHEPLSVLLFGLLKKLPFNYNVTLVVLSGLLCFIQAMLVNNMVNENKMTGKKNYLAGLLFIIYSSFFKESLLLTPASVALTFVIIATDKIFRITKAEKPYGDVFDIGVLLAIAAMFYFPCSILLIFAFAGLSTVRAFSPREWSATLMGFLVPFFLAFVYYFYTGNRPGNVLPVHILNGANFTQIQWALAAALLLCSLASFALLPSVLYSSLIQVRKYSTLLLAAFLLFGLAFFLQQSVSLSHMVLLALPAGIITAMVLFQIKNKIVTEVIHLILILLVLAGQFLPVLKIF